MTDETRQQRWYRENRERSLMNDKKWRAANPEKVAEQRRRYRERFLEKHGLTPSQYYYAKKRGVLEQE